MFNDSNGIKKTLKSNPTSTSLYQYINNGNVSESIINQTYPKTSPIVRRYSSLAESTFKSSVQRLIDTFETENRRHFAEFERVNNDLKVCF